MSYRQTSHEAPYAGGINARSIACVNASGSTVPIYSMVAAKDGRDKPQASSPRQYMKVDAPTADGNESLFVTFGKDMAGGSPGKYGVCWSVLSGPLWVSYEDTAPETGDEVGPTEGSLKVSTDGSGFIVLDVDSTNSLVWVCAKLGGEGSSGGASLIAEFYAFPDEYDECYDTDFPCSWWYATVVFPPCSGSPSAGSVIRVFDLLECKINQFARSELEADEAEGNALRFWAHKVKKPDDYEYGDGCGGCVWAIGETCCGGNL